MNAEAKRSAGIGAFLVMGLLAGAGGAMAQTPVTLDEAVSRALEDGLRVHDSREGVGAAETRVREARSLLFPQVDATFGYTRNLTTPSTFLPAILFDPDASPDALTRVAFGADNVWSTAITVRQALFDGRAFAGLGTASAFADLAREEYRGEQHDVVTGVRVRYYDLLLAEEEERLAERAIERVRETLDEVRRLHEAGLASEYDVLRLEVEVATLEPALTRARNARREASRDLSVAMGGDEGAELRGVGALSEIELSDPAANSEANRAILGFGGADGNAGRTEIRQLDLQRDLVRSEVRAEWADYLPRISLVGGYEIQAQQDGDIRLFGESGFRGYGRTVGLQVSVPLFTGLGRSARVERARTELRRVEIRRELVHDQSEADRRTAEERMEEAAAMASAQRQAIQQAEQGYRIITGKFEEGLAGRLEVMDAELALRRAKVRYAEAVHGWLVGRARLDRVTGTVPGARR